jgi:hypothetical protein
MQVLEGSAKPMRAREIHEAVEELTGKPVPYSSVKNWLAKRILAGDTRLVRLARGRYCLVP